MYRCSNCDYLGCDVVQTEDCECICPECNEECFEFEEMTEQEEVMRDNFFKEKFIPVSNSMTIDDSPLSLYLWDDWDKLNQFSKGNENIFFYTLITGDEDTMYISKGVHWVNRIGYFLSYKDIPMDEDIRYC